MTSHRLVIASVAVATAGWLAGAAAQQPTAPPPIPGAPLGGRGEAIYAAVEGWGPHKDGSNVVLVGYYNRNREQTIDIPIGPNNRIEPGGPDYGQPTHFEPGRHWGVFAIPLSKEQKLTWTLTANGHTTQVQLWLNPKYWIDFFTHGASGNTPPQIRFAPTGPFLVGPPRGIAQTLSAAVGEPVTLKVWATDRPATTESPEEAALARAIADAGRAGATGADAGRGRAAGADAGRARGAAQGADTARGGDNFELSGAAGRAAVAQRGGRGGVAQVDVTVTWKNHRAPGAYKVAEPVIRLFNKGDVNAVMEATTTATFDAPGDYWLRAQINDRSGDGGGGDQCCWTNAIVKINVKGK
jgi:hypothetical protein